MMRRSAVGLLSRLHGGVSAVIVNNNARRYGSNVPFSSTVLKLAERGETGVYELTLTRPHEHNCLNDTVIRDFNRALKVVDDDEDARALLLRAEGKSFCAGADLKFFIKTAQTATKEEISAGSQELASMLNALNTLSVPTVALVHGPAFGGGVGIVSCCDVAVGVQGSTVMALSEVKIGMIPATISPYVVSAMGTRNARRYFVTAETLDANEAKCHGLLHHVAASVEEMEQWGVALVDKILKNGPYAVQHSKKLVSDVAGRRVDAMLMNETADRLVNVRMHKESNEGIRAFLEKRKPSWIRNFQ